jgi:hypothetical protein
MNAQLTLSFEAGLPDRFATLRQFVAYRSMVVAKPQKVQAADMDLSPSTLSRKLSTGDAAAVVEYLAAKYMDTDSARHQRVVANAEALLAQLAVVLPQLKGVQ